MSGTWQEPSIDRSKRAQKRCQEPFRANLPKSVPATFLSLPRVLNRANARMPIFTKDEDFIAFETVLEEAVARTGTRLLSSTKRCQEPFFDRSGVI